MLFKVLRANSRAVGTWKDFIPDCSLGGGPTWQQETKRKLLDLLGSRTSPSSTCNHCQPHVPLLQQCYKRYLVIWVWFPCLEHLCQREWIKMTDSFLQGMPSWKSDKCWSLTVSIYLPASLVIVQGSRRHARRFFKNKKKPRWVKL